jgi:hypothetical protein
MEATSITKENGGLRVVGYGGDNKILLTIRVRPNVGSRLQSARRQGRPKARGLAGPARSAADGTATSSSGREGVNHAC